MRPLSGHRRRFVLLSAFKVSAVATPAEKQLIVAVAVAVAVARDCASACALAVAAAFFFCFCAQGCAPPYRGPISRAHPKGRMPVGRGFWGVFLFAYFSLHKQRESRSAAAGGRNAFPLHNQTHAIGGRNAFTLHKYIPAAGRRTAFPPLKKTSPASAQTPQIKRPTHPHHCHINIKPHNPNQTKETTLIPLAKSTSHPHKKKTDTSPGPHADKPPTYALFPQTPKPASTKSTPANGSSSPTHPHW